MFNNMIIILVIIISISITYTLIHFKVDISDYSSYYNTVNYELANKNTANLINANTLSNLPDVNLVTTNEEINTIRSCLTDPVKLAEYNADVQVSAYLELCYSTCGNSAEAIAVSETDEYYFSNVRLQPGVWCMINPPECNTKTAMVIATVAGTSCKSKYPRMFDNRGFNIVACNSNTIYDGSNVLWDNLNNVAVNPLTISMTDEDEKLPNGAYRFVCKYADGENENRLIAHPFDRLQPIDDRCINTVYAASYDAHTTFEKDNYTCDCGSYNDTRLKNINDDVRQPCSSCLNEETADGEFVKVSIPYNCSILNTVYSEVTKKVPCGPSKFTRKGNECDRIKIRLLRSSVYNPGQNMKVTHDIRTMPLYEEFSKLFPEEKTTGILPDHTQVV